MLARPTGPTLAAGDEPSAGAPRTRGRLARWLGLALETHISLPLFALALLGAMWFGTLHVIDAERRTAVAAERDATQELLDTYEAQLARSLSAIDQTLRVLKYAVEQNGPTGALPALEAKGLLPPGLVFRVEISDASGRIVASNPASTGRNLAGTAWFEFHRHTRDDVPFVSLTNLSESSHEPIVHFSRRISDGAGRFAGVAVVALDPAYFTSGYERSRQGDRGLLGMAGTDGMLRALRIGETVSWGQRFTPGASGGVAAGTSAHGAPVLADEARTVASRPMNSFPLVAVAGLSEAEQMAEFYQDRRAWLLGAGAASALLIAVVILVSAWSWQLAKARRRERLAQETYAAASEASPDAFFVLRTVFGPRGEVRDFVVATTNSRAERFTSLTKHQMAAKPISGLLPPSISQSVFDDLSAVARDGIARETEWQAQTLPQPGVWLHRQVVAVEGGVVVIVRDITERKMGEQRIRHLAHHDDLTGLPNRSLLRERLDQAIVTRRAGRATRWAWRSSTSMASSWSTTAWATTPATNCSRWSARACSRCLRRDDTLARFGGDEFVILLPELAGDPMAIAPLLERVREAVTEPVLVEGQEVQVSCSIGVTFYPRDGAERECADDARRRGHVPRQGTGQQQRAVLRQRDERRASTRNSCCSKACARRSTPAPKTTRAVPVPAAVPAQGRPAHGCLFGVEALIRWHHPEQGLVSPLRFIGLAEESGLIVPIGDWVLRTACAQTQAWRTRGLPPVSVSVNVSARQFEDKRLVERVAEALRASGLPADGLEVEVTESLIMRDLGRSVDKMRELEAMGVALSIDDFGTGYSSLSALKSFPISRLKIDKSFVADLADIAGRPGHRHGRDLAGPQARSARDRRRRRDRAAARLPARQRLRRNARLPVQPPAPGRRHCAPARGWRRRRA